MRICFGIPKRSGRNNRPVWAHKWLLFGWIGKADVGLASAFLFLRPIIEELPQVVGPVGVDEVDPGG